MSLPPDAATLPPPLDAASPANPVMGIDQAAGNFSYKMDYEFDALRLTRLEIEAIRAGKPLNTQNKREIAEFEAKKSRLGL